MSSTERNDLSAGPREWSGSDPAMSVVISTLDRPAKLRRTLNALAGVERPSRSTIEVLVVDNGPSRETKAVVDEFRDSDGPRFRYLVEGHGGTARARNLGIRESGGSLVAFIDDDCMVTPSWPRALFEEFSSDLRPDIVGGRVELHDSRDAPVAVRTARERQLCEWTNIFASIVGCNFCVRRPVLAQLGTFDERLGPGTPLKAAEDSDLLYRAHKADLRVLYSPRPLLYHDHGRRTAEQVLRVQRSYVIGRGGFYAKFILRGDLDALRLAYWELRECVTLLLERGSESAASVSPGDRIGWLGRGAFRWMKSLLVNRALRRSGPVPATGSPDERAVTNEAKGGSSDRTVA